MADFVSHHLFGKGALSVFPMPAQNVIARNKTCYLWGLQGPDPMFYRKIFFGSPLHKLGNKMHSEKTSELFAALAKAVHLLSDEEREMAEAYFYGFICHYSLDSEIHPYVYYRQEQIRQIDTKISRSVIHSQIESDIDYIICKRLTGQNVTEFDPDRQYRLSIKESAVLASVLHAVVQLVYGITVPTREFRRAFEEMRVWENFLYSDSKKVYKGAIRLENLVGKGALLTGHMKIEMPEWDCTNDDHTTWYNLWKPEEKRTETVEDLFALARIKATSLAGQYAAQFDTNIQLSIDFPEPFDNGNPKRLEA